MPVIFRGCCHRPASKIKLVRPELCGNVLKFVHSLRCTIAGELPTSAIVSPQCDSSAPTGETPPTPTPDANNHHVIRAVYHRKLGP